MTWVAWIKCLESKDLGGLGIRSIYALNRSLLFKWIWCFRLSSNDLQVKVIKNIHGEDGGIGKLSTHSSASSPWNVFLNVVKDISEKGVDLISLFKWKIGNGSSIHFWDDF